jgi:hypothetical protein
MVLIGGRVDRVDLDRRGGEGGFEVADGAVGDLAVSGLVRTLRVGRSGVQVIVAGQCGVADVEERSGIARLLERFGYYEGNRKSEIAHCVGIKRGLCAREAVRQVDRAPRGLRRRVVLG